MKNAMKVGPFTWKREDHGDEREVWALVIPEGANLTRFCVKDYGGKPVAGNSFRGWRLVSGGPFSNAGGWTSRDDAMRGVVRYLLTYYSDEVRRRIAEAERQRAVIERWAKEVLS